MIEYVYRPSRVVKGKRVVSRLYSGAYSLARGEKPRRVALHTPSKRVAEKMLRDVIERAQMIREGMRVPEAMRSAAAVPLSSLISAYESDLRGRGLAPSHIKETVSRLRRMVSALKWSRLGDASPVSFVAWRSVLDCAAKTKKEYQTSANAFFNWLVRMGKILTNPLGKVDRVDIRGKAVRKSRAFTQAEFSALIAAAPESRRLVYLFLAYTGARKNETASLRWSEVTLTGKPSVLLCAENTKSKEKRSVPLKPELAEMLSALRPLTWSGPSGVHSPADRLVFAPFPSDDALHADMKRAGIERVDSSGRVLHFHAFRKTFQTWGAVAGVGQRSAQEMLGHSDPSLTSGVYTDVAALQLHDEVAKLPWMGEKKFTAVEKIECVDDAQKPAKIATSSRFRGLLAELVELAKDVVSEEDSETYALPSLAARHGFEP